MSQILHKHDLRWKRIYAKKRVNFVKIKMATNSRKFKLCSKMRNFNKIYYNTLLEFNKIPFNFISLNFYQKKRVWKCNPKTESTAKHCMFGAINLRKQQKFHTELLTDWVIIYGTNWLP